MATGWGLYSAHDSSKGPLSRCNLTRAAATVTGEPALAKSTTAAIRRTLIVVPCRVASSVRRITLHLPQDGPWETAWTHLFTLGCGPPGAAVRT